MWQSRVFSAIVETPLNGLIILVYTHGKKPSGWINVLGARKTKPRCTCESEAAIYYSSIVHLRLIDSGPSPATVVRDSPSIAIAI